MIELENPINGFWDFDAKKWFSWSINRLRKFKDGWEAEIGSWEANFWFDIGAGKDKVLSEKQILANAKTKLLKMYKNNGHEIKSIEWKND